MVSAEARKVAKGLKKGRKTKTPSQHEAIRKFIWISLWLHATYEWLSSFTFFEPSATGQRQLRYHTSTLPRILVLVYSLVHFQVRYKVINTGCDLFTPQEPFSWSQRETSKAAKTTSFKVQAQGSIFLGLTQRSQLSNAANFTAALNINLVITNPVFIIEISSTHKCNQSRVKHESTVSFKWTRISSDTSRCSNSNHCNLLSERLTSIIHSNLDTTNPNITKYWL